MQLEIQELINIRNEIEKIYNKQDIQKIKELNIKAKKELKEKKNNKEEIVLLSLYEKQEEILIRIAAQEENLIKLTKEYEDKIDKFLILQNKSNTHKYNDHFNYTDIAKLSIELNKSYKEITILEKKIQAAKKEETNLKE